MGGGTGQFTVLSGIKNLGWDISAIVNMVDDGGSTGILRDDFGVLPPGDVRQCLVALSRSDKIMRDLFNYRFDKGELSGHNFGNLFITSLEKITGSFEDAISRVSDVLAIKGNVIPVTIKNTHLCLKTKNGKIIKGQHKIDNSFFEENRGFSKIFLKPEAEINKRAEKAILESDIIVIGPGSFYSSIVPNLIVKGVSGALKKTKAKKVFVCNLVNKPGQTDGFTVRDYLNKMEEFIGAQIFNYVIYNNKIPEKKILKRYEKEGENLVWFNKNEINNEILQLSADLISKKIPERLSYDKIERTLIRHDPLKIAGLIKRIYEE